VGRDGVVLARFNSRVEPESAELTGAIESALNN
jgi:glutathione peroxidase-family protein